MSDHEQPTTPDPTAANLVVARPILIADPDANARLLLAARLDFLGLMNPRVEVADAGAVITELDKCRQAGADRLPVLVLLEMELSGGSGMDVLRWMRRTSGLEAVTVLVLSADDDAESVAQAYELGVRSYLVKPVGFDALGSVVPELGLPWVLT